MSSALKPIISIKNLNVTYFAGKSNEVRALQDINLEIFPGQFIIFFGPSGCGKSTLLYTIAGLERNIEGIIMTKGKNLTTMKLDELEEYHQRVIGMIFQSFYLIPSLSIVENVALPQTAIRGAKAEREKKALGLLEKFGVGAQAKKLSSELSGGQQQRVAICRSLINEPDILIADEPVGNLDSKSSQDVMDLLRHLNDVEKKTVILVTHDPSHLRHAHHIFYLRDGKITGEKTNTPAERNQTAVASVTSMMAPATLSHWAKAYAASTEDHQKAEILGYKAQQIMIEVLSGLALEELEGIETVVHGFLRRGSGNIKEIEQLLTESVRQGGIGMNKMKAHKLAVEIGAILKEIERIKSIPQKVKQTEDDISLTMLEARGLRKVLLHTMDIELTGPLAVQAMDQLIAKRLEGKIDREKVRAELYKPVHKKGVGLNARLARHVSRRIELLVTEPVKTSPSEAAHADS